jgi:hypothetical protein
VVEEGLRLLLETPAQRPTFRLRDCSVGDANAKNPLAALDWRKLRATMYGGR